MASMEVRKMIPFSSSLAKGTKDFSLEYGTTGTAIIYNNRLKLDLSRLLPAFLGTDVKMRV